MLRNRFATRDDSKFRWPFNMSPSQNWLRCFSSITFANLCQDTRFFLGRIAATFPFLARLNFKGFATHSRCLLSLGIESLIFLYIFHDEANFYVWCSGTGIWGNTCCGSWNPSPGPTSLDNGDPNYSNWEWFAFSSNQ